jgi:DNA-binding NarL/FixJ family response regulator
MVREGIRALLEREGFQVVADASDGRQAVAEARAHRPELAVLDMSMPVMNGLETVESIGREAPDTKIVVLTRHDEDDYVMAAIRAGVKGYVLKSQPASELIRAMRDVSAGGLYLSPRVSGLVVGSLMSRSHTPQDPLSARERQMLKLIAEEHSTKECASLLEISVKTAESHRTRLMQKLGIHTTAGLVRYAVRHHVVEV